MIPAMLRASNVTEPPKFPTNPDFSSWVFVESMLSISISLFFSILIFVLHYRVVRIHKNIWSVLKFLTMADFCALWGNFMVVIKYNQEVVDRRYIDLPNDTYCVAASFVSSTFAMASFWWTFFFALHLYYIQIEGSYVMESRTVLILCNIIGWGLPLTISIFAIGYTAYGWMDSPFAHSWCWINGHLDNKLEAVWIILAGRGWEFLAYVGTLVIYMYSKIVLIKRSRSLRKKASVDMINDDEESTQDGPTIRINECSSSTGSETDLPKDTSDLTESDHVRCGNYSVILWVVFYLYLTRSWGMIRYGVIAYQLVSGAKIPGYERVDEFFFIHMQSVMNNGQATVNFLMFFVFDKPVRQKIFAKCCTSFRNCVGFNSTYESI